MGGGRKSTASAYFNQFPGAGFHRSLADNTLWNNATVCAAQSLPDKLPDSGGVGARVTSSPSNWTQGPSFRGTLSRSAQALEALKPGPSNLATTVCSTPAALALNTRVVMRQAGMGDVASG